MSKRKASDALDHEDHEFKRKLFPSLKELSKDIIEAIKNGNTEQAIEMMEEASGFYEEIEYLASDFLRAATESNNITMVTYLLNSPLLAHVIYDPSSYETLEEVINKNNIPMAKALIESGFIQKTEEDHFYAPHLHTAVYHGFIEIAQLLIANEADVNSKGGLRYSPLHYAVMEGHIEMINLLLDNGADIHQERDSDEGDEENTYGFTPLLFAILKGRIDIAERLLERGAILNLNPTSDESPSALHTAAQTGNTEMAAFILARGFDVNLSCDAEAGCDVTALHTAVYYKKFEMVQFLLDNGADANYEAEEGKPLDFAIDNDAKEIAKLLREFDAETTREGESEESASSSEDESKGEYNLASSSEGEDDASDFASEDEENSNESPSSKPQEEIKEDPSLNPTLKALISLLETYQEFGAPEALIKTISSRIEALKENAAPYMNAKFIQNMITKGLFSAIEQANSGDEVSMGDANMASAQKHYNSEIDLSFAPQVQSNPFAALIGEGNSAIMHDFNHGAGFFNILD
jgi:ankyrin repeat protein